MEAQKASLRRWHSSREPQEMRGEVCAHLGEELLFTVALGTQASVSPSLEWSVR